MTITTAAMANGAKRARRGLSRTTRSASATSPIATNAATAGVSVTSRAELTGGNTTTDPRTTVTTSRARNMK